MTDYTSPEHWVCLAGGNALGAFHVGAVTQILNADVSVQRVAGSSIGAVTGALWLGEAVGWDVWLGGALIAAGVVVAVRG